MIAGRLISLMQISNDQYIVALLHSRGGLGEGEGGCGLGEGLGLGEGG